MKLIVAAMAAVIAIIIGAAVAPSTGGGSYGPVPVTTQQPAAHSTTAVKLPLHKIPGSGLVRMLTGQQGYGPQRDSGQQSDQGDSGN